MPLQGLFYGLTIAFLSTQLMGVMADRLFGFVFPTVGYFLIVLPSSFAIGVISGKFIKYMYRKPK